MSVTGTPAAPRTSRRREGPSAPGAGGPADAPGGGGSRGGRPAASRVGTLARPRPSGVAGALAVLAVLAGCVWAFVAVKINVATMADSAGNAANFVSRMVPLDFPPPAELCTLVWQTLSIVVCATALSVAVSLPLALLAARNTTPGRPARFASRALIVLTRAVPDVIFAVAGFRIFGLGGLTGVMAMGIHSVGMVGKLYADAIEEIDEGPRRAVRATGATGWQEIVSGVLPQVLPSLVATALHRMDINLRVSVILGFVGVNGLGYALSISIGQLDYRRAMALALVLLLLCFAVESFSGAIRRTLLRDSGVPVRPTLGQRARRAVRAGVARQRPVSRDPAAHRPGHAAPGAGAGDGAGASRPRVAPRWNARRVRRACWAVLAAALVVLSVHGAGIPAGQLLDGLRNTPATVADFFPPSAQGTWSTLLSDLWVTLEISFAGTLIGVVLALPLGALAARNVAPSPALARTVRTFILCVRAIPELILAIVFVVVTGLGAVAGSLALGVGSVGLLGKLVADSLEEFDPGPAQAVRATGASRWQLFFAAIVPRAWPTLIGHLLYQLDVNLRSATLLGIVGAGGIGYDMLNAERVLQFKVVTVVVLMMLAAVLIVEGLALWLRKVFA
jgi:phosphonate transport system permease protein